MTTANIIENGGATLTKTLRKSSLKSGYMVSLKGYEKQIDVNNEELLYTEIRLANTKREIFKGSYVGVWIENGIAYIDVSINIKVLETALEIGKYNEQLAIYDIANNKVITLWLLFCL